MTDLPKTFRVKSFGCQMNVYDGERMAELLSAQGMTAAAEGEDADLVVLAEDPRQDVRACGTPEHVILRGARVGGR